MKEFARQVIQRLHYFLTEREAHPLLLRTMFSLNRLTRRKHFDLKLHTYHRASMDVQRMFKALLVLIVPIFLEVALATQRSWKLLNFLDE